MHRTARSAIAVVLLTAASSVAQEDDESLYQGQGWSTLSGKTLGLRDSAIVGQIGWPALSFAFLYGATAKVDVGVKFSFAYGFEGLTTNAAPGLKLQGLVRLGLVDTARINLGLNFRPGPFFYFYPQGVNVVGVALPIGLVAGLPVGSTLIIHAGFDVPLFITFGQGPGLVVPLMGGIGAEYFIDRRLALSLKTHMGPAIHAGGARASFAFDALLGVSYKL